MPSTEMVTYTTKHRERTRYILTPKAALSASSALSAGQISPRCSGVQCVLGLIGWGLVCLVVVDGGGGGWRGLLCSRVDQSSLVCAVSHEP